MPRYIFFGLVFTTAALIVAATAVPAAAKDEPSKFAKNVKFDGIYDAINNDPQSPLKHYLEYLGHKFDVKLVIDAAAFKAARMADAGVPDDPGSLSVTADNPLPKQEGITLGALVQTILNRLPTPTTYTFQRDRVLIVPVSEPVLKDIAREYATSPLRPLLAKRIALDNRFEAKAKLQDVVDFLRSKHNVPIVLHEQGEQAEIKLPRAANVSLEQVLKDVAKQTRAFALLRSDHVFLLRTEGGAPPGQ
jgi:hypothetical protein